MWKEIIMATLINESFLTGATSGGAGKFILNCDQISGSGNKRVLDICIQLKVAGNASWPSYYAYPVQWQAYVKSMSGNETFYSSGWMSVKGTESWSSNNGWRNFHCKAEINIKTTSAANVIVGFNTQSTSGSSLWNAQHQATFGCSSTNSAPSLTGAITTKYKISNGDWVKITDKNDGTEDTIKIPETANYIRCEWPAGTDDKGESNLTYKLYYQTNDGAWSQIYSGRNKYYEHNIGSGNEGRSYDYYVIAIDSDGAQSGCCDTLQFIKNRFTGATLNNISSISYLTDSITLSWSSASNTNGNTNFKYSIASSEIKVYNASSLSNISSLKISIVDTAITTGAYILKQDLIDKFKSSSNKGTLNFVLAIENAYGTTRTSTKSCSVDLGVAPNPVTNIIISEDQTKSTCYRTFAGDNTKYYVPDGSKKVYISWTAGSDKLGGKVTYDVFAQVDNATWYKLAADLTTTNYSHTFIKRDDKATIKFRIRTKNSAGLYSDKDANVITVYHYNAPVITIGSLTRSAKQVIIPITVKTDTSVPSTINTIGTWSCTKKNSTTIISNGDLSTVQTSQNIIIDNLSQNEQYTVTIKYKDNSDWCTEKTSIINIGSSGSIFFINKYGIGVNGEKADANSAIKLKGSILPYISSTTLLGTTSISSMPIGLSLTQTDDGTEKGYPTQYGLCTNIKLSDYRSLQLFNSTTNSLYFRTGHKENAINGTGEGWNEWQQIYHSGLDNSLKEKFLNWFYPIGSIYMSTSNSNPSNTMGGTWIEWGSGKVPVGVDSNDTDFNTVEKTGGNKTQDLRALIGAANGNIYSIAYAASDSFQSNATDYKYAITGSGISIDKINHTTPVKRAISNNGSLTESEPTTLQPYITCYMWKRTK